jgi:predicted ABC-type exoprotein transport system permease subunit
MLDVAACVPVVLDVLVVPLVSYVEVVPVVSPAIVLVVLAVSEVEEVVLSLFWQANAAVTRSAAKRTIQRCFIAPPKWFTCTQHQVHEPLQRAGSIIDAGP